MVRRNWGTCRAVAPLLARYDDRDLTEDERVLLSTHLLQCPACRVRLDTYRRHDRQLRALASIALAPQVREAVYARLATPLPAARYGTLSGLAVAALAVMLTTSLLAFHLPGAESTARVTPWAPSGATANAFAQPLGATLLAVNPTRVLLAASATVAAVAPGVPRADQAVRSATPLVGTVRVVYLAEGRVVLTERDTGREESLTLTSDTVIRLADGRPGSLGDLTVGALVHALCGPVAAGLPIIEIVVLR